MALPKTAVNYPIGKVEPNFDLKTAIKCVAQHSKYVIRGGEVHRGSYGRVYGVCDATDKRDPDTCSKKIIKIIQFPYVDPLSSKKAQDWDKKLEAEALEDLQRELYIFHHLNHSGITPRIHEEFGCGNYFAIVLDRYRTNMVNAAKQQLQEVYAYMRTTVPAKISLEGALLFTSAQMRRIFQVAKDLGVKWSVIHGDLGPHQYLFPLENKIWEDKGIVVSDFGFSSAPGGRWHAKLGWNYPDNCGGFTPIPPLDDAGNQKILQTYRNYYNIYQLWRYFSYYYPFVYVFDRKDGKLYVFPHDSWPFPETSPFFIPPVIRHQFRDLPRMEDGRPCPNPIKNPNWPTVYRTLPLWTG